MKRNTLHFGKSKNRFYTSLLVITGGACIITGILVGSFIYTTMSLSKYNAVLSTMSNELDEMRTRTNEMMEMEEEYKKELERLNQELAKYQPIVIPESMK